MEKEKAPCNSRTEIDNASILERLSILTDVRAKLIPVERSAIYDTHSEEIYPYYMAIDKAIIETIKADANLLDREKTDKLRFGKKQGLSETELAFVIVLTEILTERSRTAINKTMEEISANLSECLSSAHIPE